MKKKISVCVAMAQDTNILTMMLSQKIRKILLVMILGFGSSNTDLNFDQLKRLDRNVVQMYDIVHKKVLIEFIMFIPIVV